MFPLPILDHFHPPLSVERAWNTFHHAWCATIARVLNRQLLPEDYFASPNVQFGPCVEIDVGTFDLAEPAGAYAVEAAPRGATVSIPADFPDIAEVLIYDQEGGPRLVAAIELVSPRNKDRPEARQAFVAKMSSYLQQAVALAVIDVVTSRSAHLHNEWADWNAHPGRTHGPDADTAVREQLSARATRATAEIDLWLNPLHSATRCPSCPCFSSRRLHRLAVGSDLPGNLRRPADRGGVTRAAH